MTNGMTGIAASRTPIIRRNPAWVKKAMTEKRIAVITILNIRRLGSSGFKAIFLSSIRILGYK
jgi:hypothetical protein